MSHIHISYAILAKAMLTIGAVSALALQPIRFVGVVGRSMEPTYANGSFQMTLPVSAKDVAVGDVVVIHHDDGLIVKRIAMLPGDTYYQVKSGNHWIDLIEMRPRFDIKKSTNIYRKVQVPSDSVYVLGDNRTVSLDSRSFGFVKLDSLESRLMDQRPEPQENISN